MGENSKDILTGARNFGSLGTLTHYNGIILGNLTALQADCEGSLAIGGVATFGSKGYSFDLGAGGVSGWESICIGSYKNPNSYPTVLIGGTISQESTSSRIYSGPAAMRKSYQNAYEALSFHFEADSFQYIEDETVSSFFAYAKSQAQAMGKILMSASGKTLEVGALPTLRRQNHSDYLNKTLCTDKQILVYALNTSLGDIINIGEIDFDSYLDQYDVVVINSKAKQITFSGGSILYDGAIINTSLPSIYEGNKLIGRVSSKLIFNFPEATDITIQNYGLIGSVIAPQATIQGNGGSLNGMLIAENLIQRNGMELHAFTMAMGEELWNLGYCGEINVQKLDSGGEKGLEGAEFALYEYDEDTGEYTLLLFGLVTDEEGNLIVDNLAPGFYKLVESKPPPGYSMPEENEWIFEIIANNKGDETELNTIYIRNSLAVGKISILKLDYDDSSIKLSNVVFSLFVYNTEDDDYDLVRAGLVTDTDGVLDIEDLLPGKYKLVETSAPTGYYLPDNYFVEFEIQLDSEGAIIEPKDIEILNQLLGEVEITKKDAENGDIVLQGASFTLYKLNEATSQYDLVEANLTSGTDGKFTVTGLSPGQYKLTETAAPIGYYLPENADTFFTVEVDGESRLIALAPIDITNKLLGKVLIYKIDSEDEKILLEGAEFILYKYDDEEDDYVELRTGLITDVNGELLIEGLEPGDYKLVEIKSPYRYALPENPETLFTVTL